MIEATIKNNAAYMAKIRQEVTEDLIQGALNDRKFLTGIIDGIVAKMDDGEAVQAWRDAGLDDEEE